jgi:hypothetical protein
VTTLHVFIDRYDLSSDSVSDDDEDIHVNTVVSMPSAPENVSPPTTRTSKVKKLVSKMPKPMLHVKSLGGKKSQGNRQVRRHENSSFRFIVHMLFVFERHVLF